MGDLLTNLVEAGVGVGCLAAAWASWQRPPLRWLSIVLAVAGAAAIGHATWSLAAG